MIHPRPVGAAAQYTAHRGSCCAKQSLTIDGPRTQVLRPQHLCSRPGLQLAGVHRHRQHAVEANRAGQLDELLVAEALSQRIHASIVRPVLADEIAREVHDLRVLRRNAARVFLADRGDG